MQVDCVTPRADSIHVAADSRMSSSEPRLRSNPPYRQAPTAETRLHAGTRRQRAESWPSPETSRRCLPGTRSRYFPILPSVFGQSFVPQSWGPLVGRRQILEKSRATAAGELWHPPILVRQTVNVASGKLHWTHKSARTTNSSLSVPKIKLRSAPSNLKGRHPISLRFCVSRRQGSPTASFDG